MITRVKKRGGREVPFNIEKIANAIYKALEAANEIPTDGVVVNRHELSMDLAAKTAEYLEMTAVSIPDIEQIQDLVEKVLMEAGYSETAKKYILYRAERSRVREMNTRLMQTYHDITNKDAKESDLKRDNANVDGNTAMGTMLKYGTEGSKMYYEMFMLKPEHCEAHQDGLIHIHDLDFYALTLTCCQIDLVKLFDGGFSTGHGKLRAPKDIRSYSALACIAIQSNQNDMHGGQSIPNFDYAMARGVSWTYRKTYAANMSKALEMIGDVADPTETAKKIIDSIYEQTGLYPAMDPDPVFEEKERELIGGYVSDPHLIERIQKFIKTHTLEETDKACYQAMEALIHNLNSMHSRAGAQTPFSSINYGMDTSSE
ncbi:MAG: anaerobic ribonucleoside triphosphate reductase, partial [Deltaproteobacteria bacterium]|nr:anaerobic ribonucleoside triphosphate reductase [Deltaproteobacteria bacterium]